MAKKNAAPPNSYGTTPSTVGPGTSGTSGKGGAGGGKNVGPPSNYKGGQELGYEIGAPSHGLGSIGMVGSPMQSGGMFQNQEWSSRPMPWDNLASELGRMRAGNQYQSRLQSSMQAHADALRAMGNNTGGGSVSFPMAGQGGVPGQNSREGYDANGNYITNGPGNYDAQGNYIYPEQVAKEAQWANMPAEPTGPAVNINGVMMQPMRRADGSLYTQPVDASGQPLPMNTTRTDMGI